MTRLALTLSAAAVILVLAGVAAGRHFEWLAALGLLAFLGALVTWFVVLVLAVSHRIARPRPQRAVDR